MEHCRCAGITEIGPLSERHPLPREPAPAIWLETRWVSFEPTGYGQWIPRQVCKHRAEDRAAPLRVDTIRMRLELEKIK